VVRFVNVFIFVTWHGPERVNEARFVSGAISEFESTGPLPKYVAELAGPGSRGSLGPGLPFPPVDFATRGEDVPEVIFWGARVW
jgi:hypothetical protein